MPPKGQSSQVWDADRPSVITAQPQLCVLWKPPGWTVTVIANDLEDPSGSPARSEGTPADRPLQDWLVGQFGALHAIAHNPVVAHGLLHRLDRDTSGALFWAPSYSGYYRGRLQFAAGRVGKEYLCLCHGWMPRAPRLLALPLRKVPGRSGFRSVASPRGLPAHTEVRTVSHLRLAEAQPVSLVKVRLHTGRLHQIRAHLAAAGHPLVGETAYAGLAIAPPWCPRLFLHACRLQMDLDQGPLDVSVPLPADLCMVLAALEPVGMQGSSLQMNRLLGHPA